MKVTYSWLKEYVRLAPPEQLAQQLTLAGLEVESMAPVAPAFAGVVVGEVIESGRHPECRKAVAVPGHDRRRESLEYRLRRKERACRTQGGGGKGGR